MNNLLTTLLALAALAAGTAVAIFGSEPLVTDALTRADLGTLIGSAVTYRRERIAARRRRPAAINGSCIVVPLEHCERALRRRAHVLVAVL